MPLSQALCEQLKGQPRKPFRGLSANLTAGLLNRPCVLRLLLQYVVSPLQRIIDLTSYFVVSTHRNVRDVMERDDDFPIGPQVGPAMVCGAFVLGTDRVPQYREDLALLWDVFYEIKSIDQLPQSGINVKRPPNVLPFLQRTKARVEAILDAAERGNGRLDLVQDVSRPIFTRVVQDHLGVGPADDEWIRVLWEVLQSLALRIILPDKKDLSDTKDPVVADLDWARKTFEIAVDEAIGEAIVARANGTPAKNITERMYDVLIRKLPPAPDIRETITRNIAGLAIVGCHPAAKAAAQAVDVLLSNQRAFDGATLAARAADENLFWDFIYEALRFFPPFPLVKRGCPRDTTIGADEGRLRKVRVGQIITVGLLPAMFDADAVPFPDQFRTDRERRDSLVFGRGMHVCFGYQFARDMLVAMLMPLFARGFVRAPGREGRLSFDLVVPKSLVIRLSPPPSGPTRC